MAASILDLEVAFHRSPVKLLIALISKGGLLGDEDPIFVNEGNPVGPLLRQDMMDSYRTMNLGLLLEFWQREGISLVCQLFVKVIGFGSFARGNLDIDCFHFATLGVLG